MKKPWGNRADSMKTDNPSIESCAEIVTRRRAEANLLNQLLARGDKVGIKGGKLVVAPASGKPVPSDWFDANEPEIVQQIAVQTGIAIFRYTEYSTGRYDKHLYSGITLQFDCVTTLTDAYAIFNCILTRARTTKHGAADEPLPNKHFRLSNKHKPAEISTTGRHPASSVVRGLQIDVQAGRPVIHWVLSERQQAGQGLTHPDEPDVLGIA